MTSRALELTWADRKRLLRAIDHGDTAAMPAAAMSATTMSPIDQVQARPAQRPGVEERRQLTIMFCDLVGSTALSRQLDPEDLRDIMRQYQDAVTSTVTRYGGHVAKYLGDGVLVYFGWPQAFEDQAGRAVRAGLDAVEAVCGITGVDGSRFRGRASE